MDKKKRTQKTQKRFKGQKDEEKKPLLGYEGGDAEAPMEDMMEMMDDMMEKKEEEEKMSEKKEEEKKMEEKKDPEPEVEPEEPPSTTHLCCKYSTAMLTYGIFLWILGVLCLANVLLIFNNIYMPMYYPLVMTIIMVVYFVGLILISIWFCKESSGARTGAIIGGWCILAAIVSLILFNVFFVLNHNKHKKEGVKVGSGDDPDDYDEEDRQSYILGYLIWGGVIIVLTCLFLWCAYSHDDLYNKLQDDMDMDMETMMEGGQREYNHKMDIAERKKRLLAEYQGKPIRGVQRQRRPATSRSSSIRSVNSSTKSKAQPKTQPKTQAKAQPKAQPKVQAKKTIKNEANLRNKKQAAFKEIDNDQTPRGSLRDNLSYENGQTTQVIKFDLENDGGKQMQNKSMKSN